VRRPSLQQAVSVAQRGKPQPMMSSAFSVAQASGLCCFFLPAQQLAIAALHKKSSRLPKQQRFSSTVRQAATYDDPCIRVARASWPVLFFLAQQFAVAALHKKSSRRTKKRRFSNTGLPVCSFLFPAQQFAIAALHNKSSRLAKK